MSSKRFAIFGAGFWSHFQLAAWQELPGVQCVAVCDRDLERAKALATHFNIQQHYTSSELLLDGEQLDFVDIITDVDSHASLVKMAAERHIPVICQKPMAPNLEVARSMTATCEQECTPLYVHENWRWQRPIRRLKEVLDSGFCGRVIRAQINYANSFPVFDNQPFLKELDQFLLTDMGTHLLDVIRFLWGEVDSLYCQTQRIHSDIRGEDVATLLLTMQSGTTIVCNMSYASKGEFDQFPQTFISVEGSKGGVRIERDCQLRLYSDEGEHQLDATPPVYSWADPAYAVVHSSIVDCNRHLLAALQGAESAETDGHDNLRTLEIVYAAYQAATSNQVIRLNPSQPKV